jgi:hypothetical protein
MIKKDGANNNSAEKRVADKKKALSTATPEEGARLIRAFIAVKDPRVRKAIIAFVENLS